MAPPPGVAKFDSATAMTQALARFLHGRDFPGLGQSRVMQALVRQAGWAPRHLRERIFAVLGAQEGVAPDEIGDARIDARRSRVGGRRPRTATVRKRNGGSSRCSART